jgi:hypothetical protein
MREGTTVIAPRCELVIEGMEVVEDEYRAGRKLPIEHGQDEERRGIEITVYVYDERM